MARTRVKICCIANAEEARMAADAGADLVGLVGPMPSGPGVVTLPEARAIAAAAPAWATPVLLSAAETASGLLAEAEAAGVRAVQIVRPVAVAELDRLAAAAPALRRIQVVHVGGEAALEQALRYAPHADALLLDSGRPGADVLGGTGRVHDWAVSAEIVRRVPVPVFLAGGLGPANVGEAIGLVRPFGVDLCTGVRSDGRLDAAKLAELMAEVAAA